MPLATASRLVPPLALIVLLAAGPALADAPVPTCKGHNPAAASTAKAEGLKHYRASKHEGAGDAEMAAALGFFEAACAAGDDTALELRAYALAGAERFVEAAQSLDAFLVLHPLDTLSAQVKARIASQEPEILSRVASLTVDSPTPGAKVAVNHRDAGVTPLHLRLAPGTYDLEVVVEGKPPMTRSVDLPAGDRTEAFDPSAPSPPPAAAEGKPLPPPTVDSGTSGGPTNLKPWAIGTAIGAGVFLLGGVGGALWANERSNTYNAAMCDGTSRSGCASTLSQYNSARDVEIAGLVVGGAAAVASGVLFYMVYGREPSHNVTPVGVSLPVCGFAGTSVGCVGRF